VLGWGDSERRAKERKWGLFFGGGKGEEIPARKKEGKHV
jgi:hypothetical protein